MPPEYGIAKKLLFEKDRYTKEPGRLFLSQRENLCTPDLRDFKIETITGMAHIEKIASIKVPEKQE